MTQWNDMDDDSSGNGVLFVHHVEAERLEERASRSAHNRLDDCSREEGS